MTALMLDGAAFFAVLRDRLFGGSLSQPQVDGINRLVAAFTLYGTGDRRHLSYGCATSFHETGRRMQPVREGFAATDAQARAAVADLFRRGRISTNYALPNKVGKSFYGRGDVQLTHEHNYAAMGLLIGVDLVKDPDRALDPAISARILWEGILRGVSLRGDFTGKALEDYIVGDRCDFIGARRTVNGTDKAQEIAGYATIFEKAFAAGGMPLRFAVVSPPTKVTLPPAPQVSIPPHIDPAASAGPLTPMAPTAARPPVPAGPVVVPSASAPTPSPSGIRAWLAAWTRFLG